VHLHYALGRGQSLPDLLVDKNLLNASEARRLWGECIECVPFGQAEPTVESELFYKVGALFWWIHRMLPAGGNTVVTASRPHPELQPWLANKTGRRFQYAAELPRRLELAAQSRGFEVDPDQILIDALIGKALLRKEQLSDVAALRRLTTDSASKWLLLHRMVPEEQLHQTFVEACNLPPAQSWTSQEVKRLLPILPPGFAKEEACYPLQESNGNIRLGFGQMPSRAVLRVLWNRLSGYALCFQYLSREETVQLQKLTA